MDQKKRIEEVNFILDLLQELKLYAVKEQLFEKAAYLRGKQQDYLEEKEVLES